MLQTFSSKMSNPEDLMYSMFTTDNNVLYTLMRVDLKYSHIKKRNGNKGR